MTAVSNFYTDKPEEIVNKCNETYYRTIKMKRAGVRPSRYIKCGVGHNDQDPKLKVGDRVRMP